MWKLSCLMCAEALSRGTIATSPNLSGEAAAAGRRGRRAAAERLSFYVSFFPFLEDLYLKSAIRGREMRTFSMLGLCTGARALVGAGRARARNLALGAGMQSVPLNRPATPPRPCLVICDPLDVARSKRAPPLLFWHRFF